MTFRVSRTETSFAALCALAAIALACDVWRGGWLGLQGAVVLAGWLVAGRVLGGASQGLEAVRANVGSLVRHDLGKAWKWYYAVCAFVMVKYLASGDPHDWAMFWPYVATFTYNLTRASEKWGFNQLFSSLWIFGLMLQVGLVVTLMTSLVSGKRRVGVLVALVASAAALRLGGAYFLQSLRVGEYDLGDSLFWTFPGQLDAAAIGFGARWLAERRAPGRAFGAGLAVLAISALIALAAVTDFPLHDRAAYLWAYPLFDVALAALLVGLVGCVGTQPSSFVLPFAIFVLYSPLRSSLVSLGATSAVTSGWQAFALLAAAGVMVGYTVRHFFASARTFTPRHLTAIAAAALATLAGLYLYRTSFIIEGQRVFSLWDDAMISMTYAKNLARGAGLVWYQGADAVQGFSNFGVTMMMAVIHTFPIPEFKISLVIQLVCALGLFACVAATARIAQRIAPRQPFAAPLVVAAFCLLAPLNIWSLQGSDVAFVCAGMALLLHEVVRVSLGERLRWTPLLAIAGFGTLFRMDFAAYVMAAAGYLFIWQRARRPALAILALSGAISVGMVVFSKHYFGDWLPNTYYLKASSNLWADKVKFTLGYVVESSARLLPLVALALYGYVRAHAHERRAYLPIAGFAFTAISYNLWLGADWALQYESRFLMPAYPPLLALAVPGLLKLAHDLRGWSRAPQTAVAALALALLVLNLTPTAEVRSEWFDQRTMPFYRDTNRDNARLGLFFRRRSDPTTSVGLNWAGIPAYYADRPTVDFLGKCDRFIAKTKGHMYWPGHSKWDWSYVMEVARPDVVSAPTRDLDKRDDFKKDYVKLVLEGVDFYVRHDQRHKIYEKSNDPRVAH